MGMIKVSVIIPIYNAERYLSECLDSVLSQTLRDIEIICIDDGSTDSSPIIVQTRKMTDSRIISVRQENSGSGKARNLGLTLASGEYVAFMDADDYYPHNDVLEKMYSAAVSKKVLVCGGGLAVNRSGKTKTGIENGAIHYFPEEGIIDYAAVQYDYGYQRYMFSRKLLEENNITFPDYLRFQDPPFFARAMVAAGKFYALTIDTYCYRWGHQRVNWNFRRVNDLACGIRDNLLLSRDYGLTILHEKCMQRFNKEYFSVFENSLKDGNSILPELLFETSFFIQKDWLDEKNAEIDVLTNFLHRKYDHICTSASTVNSHYSQEISKLQTEINSIRASASYRIGRFITFIPRKIRGGIRCYNEHGMRYTMRRIKEKFRSLFRKKTHVK